MSDFFENALRRYPINNVKDKQNALCEITQQVVLAGLHRGGFFDRAAFYGGTCLRLFHQLPRFSEDMDFSLLSPDEGVVFENYFQPIIDEFESLGRKVEIKKKDKKVFGRVDSAFLKDNTDVYNVAFQTEKSVKVKIEVDTQPPLKFQTEQMALTIPYTFMVRCFQLPDLYAGKMHALVFRNWKTRVKGRDWYDFIWYSGTRIKLNHDLLSAALNQNGPWKGLNLKTSDKWVRDELRKKIANLDWDMARKDVEPFIHATGLESLQYFTAEYFMQLANQIA